MCLWQAPQAGDGCVPCAPHLARGETGLGSVSAGHTARTFSLLSHHCTDVLVPWYPRHLGCIQLNVSSFKTSSLKGGKVQVVWGGFLCVGGVVLIPWKSMFLHQQEAEESPGFLELNRAESQGEVYPALPGAWTWTRLSGGCGGWAPLHVIT